MSIPNFNYKIESLSPQHRRENFDCGIKTLNDYLQKQARQDLTRFLSAVFILEDTDQQRIAGYYTLAATAIQLADLPKFIPFPQQPQRLYLPMTTIIKILGCRKNQPD